MLSNYIYILFLFFSFISFGQENYPSISNIVSENILDVHAVNEDLVVFNFLEYRETDHKSVYEIKYAKKRPFYVTIDGSYSFVETQASLTHSFFLFKSIQDSILILSFNHQSTKLSSESLETPTGLFSSERDILKLSCTENAVHVYAFYTQLDNQSTDVLYSFDNELRLLSQIQLPFNEQFSVYVSNTIFSIGNFTFLHSLSQNPETGNYLSKLDFIDINQNFYKSILLTDELGHYIPHVIELKQDNFHLSGIYCSNPSDLNETHRLFYQKLSKKGELLSARNYSIENQLTEKGFSDKVSNRSARKLKVRDIFYSDSTISVISEVYYIENGNNALKYILDVVEPDRFVVQLGKGFLTTFNFNGNLLNNKQFNLVNSSFLLSKTTNSLDANLLNNQLAVPYIFQFLALDEDSIRIVYHKKYKTYIKSIDLLGKSETLSTEIILNDTTQFNVKHNLVDQSKVLTSIDKMQSKSNSLGDKFQDLTNSIEYAIEEIDFALELLHPLEKNYIILSNGKLIAYWLDVDSQHLIYTY